MGNPWSGEVTIAINGQRQHLKLTLGALAELEAELQSDSLVGLVERFERSEFSSRDVLASIVAGLRGGGWNGHASDLLQADIEGGPMGAARAGAELMVRAFVMPEDVDAGEV